MTPSFAIVLPDELCGIPPCLEPSYNAVVFIFHGPDFNAVFFKNDFDVAMECSRIGKIVHDHYRPKTSVEYFS